MRAVFDGSVPVPVAVPRGGDISLALLLYLFEEPDDAAPYRLFISTLFSGADYAVQASRKASGFIDSSGFDLTVVKDTMEVSFDPSVLTELDAADAFPIAAEVLVSRFESSPSSLGYQAIAEETCPSTEAADGDEATDATDATEASEPVPSLSAEATEASEPVPSLSAEDVVEAEIEGYEAFISRTGEYPGYPLSIGDSDATGNGPVAILQRALQTQGFSEVIADGVFGRATEAAVRRFQAESGYGLAADGVVGPATWDALAVD